MNQTNLYSDIAHRSGGDIYIGVVGPVRSGKSTFIKRFMELSVIPGMEDGAKRDRAIDELPVSGAGKTITTVEPRFVPAEAAEIFKKRSRFLCPRRHYQHACNSKSRKNRF